MPRAPILVVPQAKNAASTMNPGPDRADQAPVFKLWSERRRYRHESAAARDGPEQRRIIRYRVARQGEDLRRIEQVVELELDRSLAHARHRRVDGIAERHVERAIGIEADLLGGVAVAAADPFLDQRAVDPVLIIDHAERAGRIRRVLEPEPGLLVFGVVYRAVGIEADAVADAVGRLGFETLIDRTALIE